MAVSHAGTFLANTGSTVVTGVGFQPKAVYLFHCSRDTSGAPDTSSYLFSHGSGASGDNPFATLVNENDAQNPSNIVRADYTNKVATDGGAATATITYDSDGFTLTWSSAPSTRIFFIAIGGSEVHAATGTFNLDSSGATLQQIVGVGFRPQAVVFTHAGSVASSDGTVGWGATDGVNERAITFFDTDNVSPTEVYRTFRRDAVICGAGGGAVDYQASLHSFDVGGFTLNIDDVPAAADVTVGYLAFGGVQAEVGDFVQPTGVGSQSVPVAFDPVAVLMSASPLAAVASGSRGNGFVAAGAIGSSVSGSVCASSDDNLAATNCARRMNSSSALVLGDGGGTVLAEATAGSLAAGAFDLTWGTADATARLIAYLVLGGNKFFPPTFQRVFGIPNEIDDNGTETVRELLVGIVGAP